MPARRVFVDGAPGETRAAVYVSGQPERLLVEREADPPAGRPGAEAAGRVRAVDRAVGGAFLDLGNGLEALMPLASGDPVPAQGALLHVLVVTPARPGKAARVRRLGEAQGAPRLLSPAPSLQQRLAALAPEAPPETGAEAREAVDAAEDAALRPDHSLPSGGRIFVETTRALTSIDVDTGRATGDPRRTAARVNLEAVEAGARVLRLKGLGGIVVFDLVGRGHDGERLAGAARAAFAPDGSEVVIGRISRLGLFEVAVPRRSVPAADLFLGSDGQQIASTAALRLLREMDRQAGPGAFVSGRGGPEVVGAARPLAGRLLERIGPRFELVEEGGFPPLHFEVVVR